MGPRCLRASLETFWVPFKAHFPPNGIRDGGALRGVLLSHFWLPHAPNPIAACGSWEESWALTSGRGGTSPSQNPKTAHSIHLSLQDHPGREKGLHLTDEDMKAQRGAGTYPRSPSKMRGCPEKGRALEEGVKICSCSQERAR